MRLKLGISVTGGAMKRELKKAKTQLFRGKLRVSDKGDSLIKHRREQKSSHNLTGRHNGISRIKRKKNFLVFGSTDCVPLLFRDCAGMSALILVDLGTFTQFCLVFGQHFS